jgi:xanthosine utilization system XapX-like protein
MSSHPKPDQPPRLGAWFLILLSPGEESNLIIGDLSEEYFERAAQTGRSAARRWYWRQIFKSLPHLAGAAFRASPWKTAAAAALGFEFRRLMARLPERAIFAVVERTRLYEHHFKAYEFLASTGIDIAHLVSFVVVGSVVALIAKRSEIPPAIALGLIYVGMAIFASVFYVARTHDFAYLPRLLWTFSDAFAIVAGAIAVRMLRSNPRRLAAQS